MKDMYLDMNSLVEEITSDFKNKENDDKSIFSNDPNLKLGLIREAKGIDETQNEPFKAMVKSASGHHQ